MANIEWPITVNFVGLQAKGLTADFFSLNYLLNKSFK